MKAYLTYQLVKILVEDVFCLPLGGTEAMVPSISFKRACCTPSPDTSLVIEGLSDFLEILSISSMYTYPSLSFLDIIVTLLQQLLNYILYIFPYVPASVNVVVCYCKWYVEKSAKVSARSVLPEPVGPMSNMLLLFSSTSFFLGIIFNFL